MGTSLLERNRVSKRDLFDADGTGASDAPRLREAPLGALLGAVEMPAPPPALAPAPTPANPPKIDPGNDPSGHRARLRKRLLGGGAEALGDHEIIEYLLMTAIPRRDTKPLARSLLARFGSLAGVFNADSDALAKHPGMGETSAAALRIVALAARRFARAQASAQPVLASWAALISYLTIDMAHLTVERVRVLYLDSKNRLIRDEHVTDGSLDEAAIHPREVIRRALDLGAASLILVHNHPSGSPEPSRADIQITQRIAEAGRLLGIEVHDHVIIGREGHSSMRAAGLI
jgi:DNA repair protein RadC